MNRKEKELSQHYLAGLRKQVQESVQLQEGLRQPTHRVLAAEEEARSDISRELQDEVAQTLLVINVRLLTLRQQGRRDNQGLKNAISSTQRLVVKSARSVRRLAREITKARRPDSALSPSPKPASRKVNHAPAHETYHCSAR